MELHVICCMGDVRKAGKGDCKEAREEESRWCKEWCLETGLLILKNQKSAFNMSNQAFQASVLFLTHITDFFFLLETSFMAFL